MGIFSDLFGKSSSGKGLFGRLFGKPSQSRLDSVVGRDKADRGSSRLTRTLEGDARATQEARTRRSAEQESRLTDLILGDERARAQQEDRARADAESRANNRLDRLLSEDARAREDSWARGRFEAEDRLDALLSGDKRGLEEIRERKRREKEEESQEIAEKEKKEREEKEQKEKPTTGGKWIPAASSFVDAFYFEPDAPGVSKGKLWVRFTTKKGNLGQEGYYESTEDEYDQLFMAASKGEDIWDQFIYKKRKYNRTGKGALIGTRLPWPRRGSRKSKLPQKSPGRWWSRTGRTEPG